MGSVVDVYRNVCVAVADAIEAAVTEAQKGRFHADNAANTTPSKPNVWTVAKHYAAQGLLNRILRHGDRVSFERCYDITEVVVTSTMYGLSGVCEVEDFALADAVSPAMVLACAVATADRVLGWKLKERGIHGYESDM